MQRTVNITEEQIAQYQRDGAILLKGVFTAEEQKLLEEGIEASYQSPSKRSTKTSDRKGRGETFLESFSFLNSPSLNTLLETSPIPEIAARMMRAPSAQLILDQIFYKNQGHIIPTPWHQDTPYLRVRGDDMIRVWMTADYSPKELTLKIVRGSHRWNVVYDPRLGGDDAKLQKTSKDGKMLEMSFSGEGFQTPDIEKYRDSFDILTWDVEPGDALIFNGNMLHAAGGAEDYPNKRRAYTSMWGGPKLNYISPPDNAIPTLAEVRKIKVEHGACIGDYKEAFPVGWDEDNSKSGAA